MLQKSSSVGRRVLSGSLLQTGSLIASAIASFFLMPFIVHHIGDRLYGFWSLAAAVIGYYGLLDLGLSSAVSQYICMAIGGNEPAECRAIFNAALRIQSLLGGLALVVTLAVAAATPWFCHNPTDATLFWKVVLVLGINTAFLFPTKVYSSVLDAELRFDIQSGLGILGVVARTGLIICAILAGGGLLALAWVTLLATLPVTALQIWLARREAPWARIKRGAIGSKRVKSLFYYSVYTFLTRIADILRFQIDPLVISGLIGLVAVTHYRIAGLFAQYYIQLIIVSLGMMQPVLSRLHGAEDHAGLKRAFFFGTKISLWLSIFIGFAIIGWGKPFITRWMGPRYEDAYLPLVVLSAAVLLDVGQQPSVGLLYATFKHRFYTYMNWAEGLLNLVFSLALARPLGILGVALGTLIGAFFIRLVVQPWWVCKVSGIHYGQYMRFVVGNVLRSGCLMVFATAISAWGLRPSYPFLVASAVCTTSVYALGSWLLVFSRHEREQLLDALRNRRREASEQVGVTVAS